MSRKIFLTAALAVCLALAVAMISAGDRDRGRRSDRTDRGVMPRVEQDARDISDTFDPKFALRFDAVALELAGAEAQAIEDLLGLTSDEDKAAALLLTAAKQKPSEAYATLNRVLDLGLEEQRGERSRRLLAQTYEKFADLYVTPERKAYYYAAALKYTDAPELTQELNQTIEALGGAPSVVHISRTGAQTAAASPQDFGEDDTCDGGPQVWSSSKTRMSIADPDPPGSMKDRNWLQIVISGPLGESLEIETTSEFCNDEASCSSADFDTDMTLWKFCQDGFPDTPLARDINQGDGGLGWLSKIETDCLLPGVYFLRVVGQFDSAPKNFDVEVRVVNTCEVPVSDAYEPDDTIPDASDIGHPSSIPDHASGWRGRDYKETQDHSMFPPNDDDHTRIGLSRTERVQVGTAVEFGLYETLICKQPLLPGTCSWTGTDCLGDGDCVSNFGPCDTEAGTCQGDAMTSCEVDDECIIPNTCETEILACKGNKDCPTLCTEQLTACETGADCASLCSETRTVCADAAGCESLCTVSDAVCGSDDDCDLTCSSGRGTCSIGGNICQDDDDCVLGDEDTCQLACASSADCANFCNRTGEVCTETTDCSGICINNVSLTFTSIACELGTESADCPGRCDLTASACSTDEECSRLCSIDGEDCVLDASCSMLCSIDGESCLADAACAKFCSVDGTTCASDADCTTCSLTQDSCGDDSDCSNLCSVTQDSCLTAGDCTNVCSDTGAPCLTNGDCQPTGTCEPQSCDILQICSNADQACDVIQTCDSSQVCETVQTCIPAGGEGPGDVFSGLYGSTCVAPTDFGSNSCLGQTCDTCEASQSCDALTCTDTDPSTGALINPCIDSTVTAGPDEDTQLLLFLEDDPNDGGLCNTPPLEIDNLDNFCRSDADCDPGAPPATSEYPQGACIPLWDLTFPGEAFPRFQQSNPLAFNDDANPQRGNLGSLLDMCLPRTGPSNPTMAVKSDFVARSRGWRPPFPGSESQLAFDYQVRSKNFGPCAYEAEPNNRIEDATPITPNAVTGGMWEGSETFPAPDQDWYGPWDIVGQGTINDPDDTGKEELSIQVIPSVIHQMGDTELEVWAGPNDEGKFVIVASENTCTVTGDPCTTDDDCGPDYECVDNSGNAPNSILNLQLPPASRYLRNTTAVASYYVRVFNHVLVPNFYYTVNIITPLIEGTETEPNDPEPAANVFEFRGNTIVHAEISQACDINRFRFTLTGNTLIDTRVEDPGTDSVLQVQKVEIDPDTGEEVFDFVACADDNFTFAGNPWLSQLTGCLEPGDYVVSVRGWNQTGGPYDLIFSGAPGCTPSDPLHMVGDGASSSFCPENGWPFERLCP